MIRRVVMTLALLIFAAAHALALQAPGDLDGGFRPLSELPPGQQLPAAPFLIAAYAFIWVGLMVYLWSIWHRLGKVEKDIQALERRTGRDETR